MGKKYKNLFENMCCSYCRNDIEREAFEVVRKDKGMNVVRMVCPKCGKDFGLGILKVHEAVGQPMEPLEIINGEDLTLVDKD